MSNEPMSLRTSESMRAMMIVAAVLLLLFGYASLAKLRVPTGLTLPANFAQTLAGAGLSSIEIEIAINTLRTAPTGVALPNDFAQTLTDAGLTPEEVAATIDSLLNAAPASFPLTVMTWYLVSIVAMVGILSLLGVFIKMNRGIRQQNLRAIGIILVAVLVTLLVFATGAGVEAALGLLGAIVGYLFGKDSTANDGDGDGNGAGSDAGDDGDSSGRK